MQYHFRFIMHAKKTAFVVEHDFIMATYLADRIIAFDGEPSVCTKANSYVYLLGLCCFWKFWNGEKHDIGWMMRNRGSSPL